MKTKTFFSFFTVLTLILIFWSLIHQPALAEDLPAGVTIPKLPKTTNDPILTNGHVYPFWGPVCQRYSYSVVYSDKENRPPEYVKIYFNGQMLEMAKEDEKANDYQKGVKYIFQNIPNKYGSNFYYFEASNGQGKTRASIIDSPDNGPVLFDSDFKDNEIVLIDPTLGQVVWRFSTGKEWIGGLAFSDDGRYLTAQTSNHLYLFQTDKAQPLWRYQSPVQSSIGGDVKGGVAISADGQKVFAALNGKALMFDRTSDKPVWTYNLENHGGGAYGVDLTPDAQRAAVAMAGSESNENSNVLILLDSNGKKLWQYHSSGNWHEVNFSADGQFIAGATGCPDRRGYLFKTDSPDPLIKSEPLSAESPIDEARISADGSLAAFGVESAFGAIVLMDSQTKQIVWKYQTPQNRSVRALAITPDGSTIGAGTFGGDILLFNKNSNQPIEQLKINSAIGAFDFSADGAIFATGSADKKVRVFERGSKKAKIEVALKEYVGELDISANGQFVAAGTSGSVYFFETLTDLNDIPAATCAKITEPPKEDQTLFSGQSANPNKTISLPEIISTVSAGLVLIFLIIYLLICLRRKSPFNKLILIGVLVLLVLALTAVFYFWKTNASDNGQNIIKTNSANKSDTDPKQTKTEVTEPNNIEKPDTSGEQNTSPNELNKADQSPATTKDQNVIKTESNSTNEATTTNTVEGGASSDPNICGNGICEPDLGETLTSCPRDCSGGN